MNYNTGFLYTNEIYFLCFSKLTNPYTVMILLRSFMPLRGKDFPNFAIVFIHLMNVISKSYSLHGSFKFFNISDIINPNIEPLLSFLPRMYMLVLLSYALNFSEIEYVGAFWDIGDVV